MTECALSSEPRLLHNRLAERVRWTDWKIGVSLCSMSVIRTGDDEGAIVSILVRPARFVFGPMPRNDWQAKLHRLGGDNWTQAMRRYAVP